MLGSVHILTSGPKAQASAAGEIVARELGVSSGDATKMFDAIEETFDDVSSAVQQAAVPTLGLSIRMWRADNLGMRSTESVRESVLAGT